jgi:hypothetical protein
MFFTQASLRPANGQTRSASLLEEGVLLIELPLGFKKKQNQAQTVQPQLSSFKHNQAYLVQT